MTSTLKRLYVIRDARELRRAMLMFVLVLSVGLFEVIGVASIMPFVAVLANPEVVDSNQYMAKAKGVLEVKSTETFLFVLGLVFFTLMIGSLALRALTTWAQVRFLQMRNYSGSTRLLEGYLRRPYEWYLNRYSSNLANTLLGEVNQVLEPMNSLPPRMDSSGP